MNLKQAKKLRRAAKFYAGPNWERAYRLYKAQYKANPVPMISLKKMHETIKRETEGQDFAAVVPGLNPAAKPGT